MSMTKEVGRLNKSILQEYMDACELIKETECDIQKLNRRRCTIIHDSVKGSMNGFPYTESRFHMEGSPYTYQDDIRLRMQKKLLEERKADAERIKTEVESWMNHIPARMQRIVRYRYLEGLSWQQVAAKMGRKATESGIKKEFERFMKKN